MSLLLILLPVIFLSNINGNLDVDSINIKLLADTEKQVNDLRIQQDKQKLQINALKRALQAEGFNITNIPALVGDENETDPFGVGKTNLIQNNIWMMKTLHEQRNPTVAVDQLAKTSSISLIGDFKFIDYEYNPNLPKNCAEIGKTGVFRVRTPPFIVACNADMQGGKWAVIQRRKDGSVDFYRPWKNYKAGFGNLSGDFFIGLENLHLMTTYAPQELLIVMEDNEKVQKYAKYDSFAIGSERELYTLHTLGSYAGDAGDALSEHKLHQFTTYDLDNDKAATNCAQLYTGAWWYMRCHRSNLNGDFGNNNYGKGINWLDWHGYNYSLKSVEMMIRAKEGIA